MSRIGKKPITVPSGVKVTIGERSLEVEGKGGKLSAPIPPGIRFELDGATLTAVRPSDEKPYPAYHGLARALAANLVHGVTNGFSKDLDLVGIGYKVDAKPKAITLALGYSHPIEFPIPQGIGIKVEKQNKPQLQNYVATITISGADKQLVGQVAADIRSLRRPDAYKGKGLRYAGETIKLKVGKKGA
ncbi:MAG: 50S ribosomal protein L6 [Acidobacteriota bacterium]|jgi:large subunit ribosomal protein L6|nr:50S ribosomal protein L6 [Acidobacteriota bacterium]